MILGCILQISGIDVRLLVLSDIIATNLKYTTHNHSIPLIKMMMMILVIMMTSTTVMSMMILMMTMVMMIVMVVVMLMLMVVMMRRMTATMVMMMVVVVATTIKTCEIVINARTSVQSIGYTFFLLL